MLTKERAVELVKQAGEFPFWGEYTKFMTEEEKDHLYYLWINAKNGNVTVASIVSRIARDIEIELKEGAKPYQP